MRSRPRVRKARAAIATGLRRAALSAVALTLVAAGAWATWARAVPYVTGHDYFRLRTIRVSSDETRVTPQTLAEIAGLYEDASLWEVDPDSIRETLRDASWVRHAEVSRHFPWQVNLTVNRRYAVAAAVVTGRAFLVDGEGVLFQEVEKTALPDLPYLTGWDDCETQAERAARLRALLGVLDAANVRKIEVSELHMDADGSVWLYAAGIKASVRLGQVENTTDGLEKLAIALAELGPLAERARVIDTDYPGRIVIRGVDDKLPAMLAAHTEKVLAAQVAVGQASDPDDAATSPALPYQADQTSQKAARRG
ncbi:MAG: cell division protein FtsQ/DivIB [Candidatus Binatia bacterium]